MGQPRRHSTLRGRHADRSFGVKRLWVLRHAKSSWSHEGLADHDRPLNRRGERAAVLIGAALAQRGVQLDRILASTALRVRQTLDRVQAQLAAPLHVSFEKDLYLASAETWLEQLRCLEEADQVLAVGHNPGLEDLLGEIAATGETDALRRLRHGLATATLAEIALPIADWGELGPGSGRLITLLRPKDLV